MFYVTASASCYCYILGINRKYIIFICGQEVEEKTFCSNCLLKYMTSFLASHNLTIFVVHHKFQKMERRASMQRKMVVLQQNSSLKLNVLFKMVHHSLGFLCALLGHRLVCAVNRVSSIVWWNFVQILRCV